MFIAQPASTFPATDARQFYVSVSRARDNVKIYTDDKAALLDYASDLGDRQSAMELVSAQEQHLDHVLHHQRNALQPMRLDDRAKQKLEPVAPKVERDYEPGL